jgi:hypothetical protein
MSKHPRKCSFIHDPIEYKYQRLVLIRNYFRGFNKQMTRHFFRADEDGQFCFMEPKDIRECAEKHEFKVITSSSMINFPGLKLNLNIKNGKFYAG